MSPFSQPCMKILNESLSILWWFKPPENELQQNINTWCSQKLNRRTKNNNRPKLKGQKVKTSKSLGTKKIVNPKKQNDDGMQFSIQR